MMVWVITEANGQCHGPFGPALGDVVRYLAAESAPGKTPLVEPLSLMQVPNGVTGSIGEVLCERYTERVAKIKSDMRR